MHIALFFNCVPECSFHHLRNVILYHQKVKHWSNIKITKIKLIKINFKKIFFFHNFRKFTTITPDGGLAMLLYDKMRSLFFFFKQYSTLYCCFFFGEMKFNTKLKRWAHQLHLVAAMQLLRWFCCVPSFPCCVLLCSHFLPPSLPEDTHLFCPLLL